jgi:hypothetical protein
MSSSSSSSSESLSDWVSKTFDIPVINASTVAEFIAPGVGVKKSLEPLLIDELVWLLVYDIVEHKKYSDKELTLANKLFLVAARKEFENILKVIEINFDLNEIWKKSGN